MPIKPMNPNTTELEGKKHISCSGCFIDGVKRAKEVGEAWRVYRGGMSWGEWVIDYFYFNPPK